MATVKAVRKDSDDYVRGFEAAKSAMRLFGMSSTEFILSKNHPKGRAERFKAQANKDFVHGCLDAVTNEKKQRAKLETTK